MGSGYNYEPCCVHMGYFVDHGKVAEVQCSGCYANVCKRCLWQSGDGHHQLCCRCMEGRCDEWVAWYNEKEEEDDMRSED